MSGVLRTRKDGGTSICHASDKNVGKRRCCHVLDNASISVQKSGSTNFIDISGQIDGKDTSFNIKANSEKIKDYITNLSKGLTDKERDSILSAIESM